MNELLALHEMFRRMGYQPEELFVVVNADTSVQFLLRHKGKDFVIDVSGGHSRHGVDGRSAEEFGKEWNRALAWWNDEKVPDFQRNQIYRASEALAEAPMIATVLQGKGFIAPKTLN